MRRIQVHRASATTDADGTRRATVMFAAGTHAEMTLKDGSKQPLDQLDVRATEYTVGDTGRAAMPGALPPASGYTYAVELSVDQAVEAGATDVRFDKPVVTYVDNFLDFPVGGVVPIGYYDREHGRWVASENGRVVKIVGETNGRADVDIDGDGTADDGTALGITDDERERLADLYDPGKSLWRVAVTHFTPWDCNWPYAPPADSVPPPIPVPNQDQPNKLKPKKECIGLGSIIGCQGQRLGQTRRAHRHAVQPALLERPHARLQGPERAQHAADPGQGAERAAEGVPHRRRRRTALLEDLRPEPRPRERVRLGRQGRLRPQRGRHRAGDGQGRLPVRPRPYSEPKGVVNTFGRLSASGNQIEGARNRMDLIVWSEHRDDVETVLGGFDARAQGLGGWTLDVNHLYDARTHTVHLGSGGHINADPIITTAAGNGNAPSFPRQGDGQDGPNAPLGEPYEAEVGPDGTVYFTEVTQTNSGSLVGAVRMIDPDGHVRTLATGLGGTIGLGVADDGTVYVAESTQRRVQRITPDGVVHPFAGGGTATGEGIPAASAKLNYPSDVAVSPDGRVYIAENVLGGIGTIDHGIVREVGPDGLMTTVAGGGSPDDGVGDGGPATQARLESGAGIALGQSGELLIAETHRIRRVDAGGTITTIAGGGDPEHGDGDGGQATDATIARPSRSTSLPTVACCSPTTAACGASRSTARSPRSPAAAAAGRRPSATSATRAPRPRPCCPAGPGGVAAAPDGSFYVTTGGDEGHSGRIRKVHAAAHAHRRRPRRRPRHRRQRGVRVRRPRAPPEDARRPHRRDAAVVRLRRRRPPGEGDRRRRQRDHHRARARRHADRDRRPRRAAHAARGRRRRLARQGRQARPARRPGSSTSRTASA